MVSFEQYFLDIKFGIINFEKDIKVPKCQLFHTEEESKLKGTDESCDPQNANSATDVAAD